MANRTADILHPRFMRRIIDSMADGVFILDPDGKIISWNRAMETISGYSAAHALGKTCGLLQCSRCFGDGCPADIGICRIRERDSSGAKECALRHRDGHIVPVIKHASTVRDEDGTLLGIVETVTDLTKLNEARRLAEEASLKLAESHRLERIIGKSQEMRDVFRLIRLAAASNATVLILGESGTGKELIAGAIHFLSERRQMPLITFNCSALPENLLESELFGHVRGAYTGAVHNRIGRFEEADKGTIFLDEIGELQPFIQVKLLRVLQSRTIERVGESAGRAIDIRVIAATHQDLAALVAHGTFREDLFYRLNVFPIRVPPLRDRREDIPLLVSHFIQSFNARTQKTIVDLSREVMRLFMDHHWPGNVRELENAMEHAFVLCQGDRIEAGDLPEHLRQQTARQEPPAGQPMAPQPSREKVSRAILLELLAASNWNKAAVARRLGVSHTSIWKYMRKFNIPLNRTAPSPAPGNEEG